LQLADNRRLLDHENPDLAVGRLAFDAELRDLVRRVRVLAELDQAAEAREPVTVSAGRLG